MRRLIGIALLLAFAVGLVLSGGRDDKMPAPSAQVRDTEDPQNRERICVEIVRPAAASAGTAVVQTKPVILNVCDEGRMERVALEDYLVSVLAGEMPASYPMEALKAQAIAARSYIAAVPAGRRPMSAPIPSTAWPIVPMRRCGRVGAKAMRKSTKSCSEPYRKPPDRFCSMTVVRRRRCSTLRRADEPRTRRRSGARRIRICNRWRARASRGRRRRCA